MLNFNVLYQEGNKAEDDCIVLSFPQTGGLIAIPVNLWSAIKAKGDKVISNKDKDHA